ncbi:hypothetical protein [Flavobacterium chungangensis]|uniref:Uncharacterized protein n=1 Tax=Flavobacterium chungangensis TaxID=2708132 RepID=A0ABV8ZFT2_9FLAO
MEKIEKLIPLLPVGSIFILFCSSIKLIIYYKTFNIQIVDYIEIQEFITSFIDDLLLYSCIFGITIILYLYDFIQDSNQDYSLKSDTPELYKNERRITLIISIIILITIIVSAYYSNSTSKLTTTICVGSFLFLSTFRIYLSSTTMALPFPLFIMTIIIIYTIMYGSTDAYKIIENKDQLNYTIVFKEKTYYTDKNLKYIGKTGNFLFLYNLKSKRATILKNDELIKINIKE